MWSSFKYCVLCMLRNPGIIIWALVFPVILSTVFMIMFEPIDDLADFDPVPIVAVEPGEGNSARAFQEFLDAVSSAQDGEGPIFYIEYAENSAEAQTLVSESAVGDEPYAGYVELVDDEPRVSILSGADEISSSIFVAAMNEYKARASLIEQIIEDNPGAFADSDFMESVYSSVDATRKVALTEVQPKESVRYYFALLGMAALFGGNVGITAMNMLKPDFSALGARRSVGALSHAKSVFATLIGCWFFSFACLAIVFAFMRFVVGMDFAGREFACLCTIAVSSIMATALGCAVSAIPKISDGARTGTMTAIVCFSALFAGLYGEPTMKLADEISSRFPYLDFVNPAVQISQSFYSIMYYDSFIPLMGHLMILLLMTLVLFVLASGMLKGASYDSI